MMRNWGIVWMLLASLLLANIATAAPLIYTGYDVSFAKEAFAQPSLPASQDSILPDVAITRANSRGLYNIAQEAAFVDNLSPAGTEWAFANNNSSATLSASNWASLEFTDWQTALGGGGSLATSILDGDAVLHLVDQDIYLDIRFTAWGMGSGAGGSFAYDRAEISPSADFDRDGDVDGQDFLTWQRNFGTTSALQSLGDADFDGVVTAADLAIWQSTYGNPLIAVSAIPEPAAIALVGFLSLGLALRSPIRTTAFL